jgi:hypothetical protein
MRVLVLTDYYPLKLLLGQMSVLIGQDWASIAAANFLAAKELGLTELNLVRAVTEKNSIKEVQKMGSLAHAIAKHRLLVWNYFPFLRGGSECEGAAGLPDLSNPLWLSYCDRLLAQFLRCVDAAEVILALKMTSCVPCKFRSDASKPVSNPFPPPRSLI